VTSSPTWAVGYILQYVCDDFYEISGENPITCLSTGVWSNDVPACGGKSVNKTYRFARAFYVECLTKTSLESNVNKCGLKYFIR